MRLGGQRRKRAIFMACAAVACVACLCAGFWVGRYTDFAARGTSGVMFQEPLVAQAVRMQLGLGENEPIAENDLLKVTEINLYGDQVAVDYAAFDEINQHMALNDGAVKNGGIVSLADMTKLKNLCILRVVLEDITDLSPLSRLTGLEVLDLRHNPIESVSPLATLTRLNTLCLYGTRVTDLS
jgi:internalin A